MRNDDEIKVWRRNDDEIEVWRRNDDEIEVWRRNDDEIEGEIIVDGDDGNNYLMEVELLFGMRQNC